MRPSSQTHYYIRWSDAEVDRERHETRAAARAQRLRRAEESFTIETFEENCCFCREGP